MTTLKIANWNIQWMNRWFTGDGNGPPAWKPSADIAGVSDIAALTTRVANVISTIDADILTVQEGPSRKTEMELFVSDRLNDAYEVIGPVGGGSQKLFTLVKRASALIASHSEITAELGFDVAATWPADVDGDLILDTPEYDFTRPPQITRFQTSTGKTFRLLNLHLKSKHVHAGETMWNNDRDRFIREAMEARRRISTEAMQIRNYLNLCFTDDPNTGLIVTGDLNDGPGADYFERLYLTHNVAGMIAGSPFSPQRMLRHAFIDIMAKELNFTCSFDNFVEEIDDQPLLLDHIFLSPSLFWTANGDRNATGLIEHQAFEDEEDPAAPQDSRQRWPSDHRPQSVTLEV